MQTTTLLSRLGSEVHFAADEPGTQWAGFFELQNAVEWRMVMSRGQDERTHMQSMSSLISTREDLSNRELIDDGAAWVLQGNE